MNIHLEKVNRDNVDDVCKLSVYDEQDDFVADNVYSLAQAGVRPECVPLAIYNGDELVGFIMYHTPYFEDDNYWIFRLMIDKNHQKKGYGRTAMQMVIDIIKQDKNYSRIYTSFEPTNTVARAMYESLGFAPDGREDDEIVFVLNY